MSPPRRTYRRGYFDGITMGLIIGIALSCLRQTRFEHESSYLALAILVGVAAHVISIWASRRDEL